MAHINFIIPSNKSELLSQAHDFFVQNVVGTRDLLTQIKNCKRALKDEGAEFIVDAFDTYYSILHHADSLQMDLIYEGYEDLHKAVVELNRSLTFLLEDKDNLNEEIKMKFCTILKMLVYLYTQLVLLVEQKNTAKSQVLLKARKKSSNNEDSFVVKRKNVILALNNLIQHDLELFWDPPIVEESFINLVSEVVYRFLSNPGIKQEKELHVEIFSLIGCLIKSYSHGTMFVIRMVQLIKMNEHLVALVPEGVQVLVQNFNCKGLVHDLIKEITEWQTDEKGQDSHGARNCSLILTDLAVLMPDLMIPEIVYLNRYLGYDSPTLRNSVLSVITEVIVKVLSSLDLTEDQKESRDELLSILTDHIEDITGQVRSKVIQHWTRLQKENAIPVKLQNDILEKIVSHLRDKGAMVRKSAANCVGTFLSHNLFSSNLSLKSMREELKQKQEMLNCFQEQFDMIKKLKLVALEEQWNGMIEDLQAALKDEMEDSDKENEECELPKEQIPDIIRLYLNEGKYREAIIICRRSLNLLEQSEQFKNNNDNEGEEMLIILMLKHIFINVKKLLEDLKNGSTRMTEDDVKKMGALEAAVDFLKDSVRFLEIIDSAIEPLIEMLETTAIGDMHEAIEFFTCAYQFNIDNAHLGILAMLQIMQRNEQDRKDLIIHAFKKIYLGTDSKNLAEHTTTIVNRLVQLIKTVPISNLDNLQSIISEWSSKGVLDNAIIDMLWQFYTKKIAVSDEDSRAATEVLRMAALGRKTIITRNIKLVATVAFAERGEKCMQFLGSSCDLLAVAGRERVDMESANPLFKLKYSDSMFNDLLKILVEKFFEPVDFYNKALIGGLDFVFKLSNKPEIFCEKLIKTIVDQIYSNLKQTEEMELDGFLIVRMCQLLGTVCVRHLEFLDDTIYKEMKRRCNIREERKEGKNNEKQKKKKKKTKASPSDESSVLNNSANDDSVLEGAQAIDEEAELIRNILENNTVNSSIGLGKLAYLIANICQRPDIYDDVMLQGSAVIALIRYMLVSSNFCQKNIQLLFTIFEKTSFDPVKCSILVHLSDLLTRFPNIIEPWTPKIYERLKDPSDSIRKVTFFTLSNLILRDMIRAHSHISEMVPSLVDPDTELRSMCKTFFVQLSHKENNLYNVLPDIFSHLIEDSRLSDEEVTQMMKFLFELIDKTKHMENLVDRFCCKFRLSEDIRHHRHIAYCLTLINYNDKALRKLQDSFMTYKHLVHDPEIYASFKQILQSSMKAQVGKVDLKDIVEEIEKNIQSVFELNEDGHARVPVLTRKARGRPARSKKVRKIAQESEDEEALEELRSPVSKKKRGRKPKVVQQQSDSSD